MVVQRQRVPDESMNTRSHVIFSSPKSDVETALVMVENVKIRTRRVGRFTSWLVHARVDGKSYSFACACLVVETSVQVPHRGLLQFEVIVARCMCGAEQETTYVRQSPLARSCRLVL